jgi:hypothetical protein
MGKMSKGTWAASGHWEMTTKRGRAKYLMGKLLLPLHNFNTFFSPTFLRT